LHALSLSVSCTLSLSPSCALSLSLSHVQPPKLDDIDNNSEESNTSTPELWDPYAGLKPSELDSHVLDADIEMEEDLLPREDEEVCSSMVKMMVDLEQYNDREWLPPRL